MSTEITTPGADEQQAHETPNGSVRQPRRNAPATVVNGPRVTIAFPFSHLSVSEPSSEVRTLAELVVELADALVMPPGDDAAESLRQRARTLRDGLSPGSRP